MLRTNVAELAAKQAGAFTWQQARLEYTRAEVRARVDRNEWVRVFYRVYRLAATPPTPALMVEAARLSMDVGEAIACYSTAALLYGFVVVDDPAVHVLASERRTSRPGLVVHRDGVLPGDVRSVGVTLATSPARTAVDMARTLNRLDALPTLDSAIRRGVPRSSMQQEVARHARRPRVGQAAELVSLADGRAESPMESRTRLRCVDAGLPRPIPQFEIRMGARWYRLDLAWPEFRIGLEYESGEWHTGAAVASRDNSRHNALTNLGWSMFYATADQVYLQPESFTEPIRERMVVPAHRGS